MFWALAYVNKMLEYTYNLQQNDPQLQTNLFQLIKINQIDGNYLLFYFKIHKHADGGKTLKLGDFGLAIEIKEPINQICGSPIYIAPEILMGKQ